MMPLRHPNVLGGPWEWECRVGSTCHASGAEPSEAAALRMFQRHYALRHPGGAA